MLIESTKFCSKSRMKAQPTQKRVKDIGKESSQICQLRIVVVLNCFEDVLECQLESELMRRLAFAKLIQQIAIIRVVLLLLQ